jgi:hypothetical protein
MVSRMEIDHRGFFHRPVWPTYELSPSDRIQIIVNSEEFAAVVAAIIYHLAGFPNIPFFAQAIVIHFVGAYVSFLLRDGVYDRQAEVDLGKAILPRLLYIGVTILLPRLRWLFWAVGFRIRPEDLIPDKIWSTVFITSLATIYVDGGRVFRILRFLKK